MSNRYLDLTGLAAPLDDSSKHPWYALTSALPAWVRFARGDIIESGLAHYLYRPNRGEIYSWALKVYIGGATWGNGSAHTHYMTNQFGARRVEDLILPVVMLVNKHG